MITIGKAAKIIGVHVRTLINWDNKGLLVAKRTPTNRRYYTKDQLKEFSDGDKNKERSIESES